jgi:hypothetical protein
MIPSTNSHPASPEDPSDRLARRALFGFLLTFACSRTIVFLIMCREETTPTAKSEGLKSAPWFSQQQRKNLLNPDARIVLSNNEGDHPLLSAVATSCLGLGTGDMARFTRKFFEMTRSQERWAPLQAAPTDEAQIGDCTAVIDWNLESGRVHGMTQAERERIHNQDQSGRPAWGKKGVGVALMGSLRAFPYHGAVFEKSMAVILPIDKKALPAIWAYCSSPDFAAEVREIEHGVIVANGALVKVPFDRARWETVAHKQYPNGLPEPYSEDPTQWIFKGSVVPSTDPLQVAVARLLGYRWPDQERDDLDVLTDRDGIVCIPPVGGEPPAADRLRALLAKAHGKKWKAAIEGELLGVVAYEGKYLDEWLRDGFFEQHCKLFHHRPFIWHIWDGRKKDGFHALVNYHRLDHRLLEKLTFTTLGSWIQQLRQAEKKGEATAEARIAAAVDLQTRLEAILEGENPYDIFVRWKPVEEQPIGWEPDLNDGVRLNIRPFVTAEVLRKKPNVKWEKDRGKNPPGAPWGEERLNDLHPSLDEKRKARKGKGHK